MKPLLWEEVGNIRKANPCKSLGPSDRGSEVAGETRGDGYSGSERPLAFSTRAAGSAGIRGALDAARRAAAQSLGRRFFALLITTDTDFVVVQQRPVGDNAQRVEDARSPIGAEAVSRRARLGHVPYDWLKSACRGR